jgi:dTDP-4-dehydrorhamnose reductase
VDHAAAKALVRLISLASALVLGSTGMVGRAVAEHLQKRGLEVVCANRSGAGGAHAFDAADPTGIESLVAGADLVVNAVGVLRSDPEYPGDDYVYRAAQVNTAFPLFVAGSSKGHVVHISTDAVFAPGANPADEETTISATEPYGLSKALGEVSTGHVVNIRCSAVGPAPGRTAGLWEWFISRPNGAEVVGYRARWTGVTSHQLAVLSGDLADERAFERVRAAGPTHHFIPNEAITKFELLSRLRDAVRADLRVIEGSGGEERVLVSRTGALDGVYSGPGGWDAALAAVVSA